MISREKSDIRFDGASGKMNSKKDTITLMQFVTNFQERFVLAWRPKQKASERNQGLVNHSFWQTFPIFAVEINCSRADD